MSARYLCVVSLIALTISACSPKADYTPQERETVATMTPSSFQPATREMRENIETQDQLSQAAFWGREFQINPADLEAAIKLASSVRRMGNPNKAIEITQQTRAMYPEDPYLLAEYAAALIASERGSEALKPLDQGLRKTPGYARLWSLKGAALDQVEQYDLARQHYTRALRITPYDPNIMANLGLSFALAGDPKQAEVWLQRAATQPGAGANIQQNLNLVRELQGKPPIQGTQKQTQTAQQQPRQAQPQNRQVAQRPMSRPMTNPSSMGGPYSQHQSRSVAPRQSRPTSSVPRVAEEGAPRGFIPPNNPSLRQQAPQKFTQQMPVAPASQPPAGFNSRSSFAYSGQLAEQQSASDALRAAARQSQSNARKVVIPAEESAPTDVQQDILSKISGSIGPQRSGAQMIPRSPQAPAPQRQQNNPAYAPEQLRQSQYAQYPQYGQPQQPQGYAPQGYAPQGYAPQGYAPQGYPSQQPQSRGAARRR